MADKAARSGGRERSHRRRDRRPPLRVARAATSWRPPSSGSPSRWRPPRGLDAGASTGGFTDCLLQRGVASVTAVDVGYGQLHPRLRSDPRVDVRERTNIRTLADEEGLEPFELIVADLSFISLTVVVPVLLGSLAVPGADLVLLVKPQFEVGQVEASRGRGVVRHPALRRIEPGQGRLRPHGRRSDHHGRHGVTRPRSRRQCRVPPLGPPGPPDRPVPSDLAAALDAAVAQSPDGQSPHAGCRRPVS